MTSRPRQRTTPFADSTSRFLAGRLGTWVFIASLAMLFGATLIGFAVIRTINAREWPAELPPLPPALWLSTALLLVSSATMQAGLEAIKRNRLSALSAAMLVSLTLGLGFLAVQGVCWVAWLDELRAWWDGGEIVRFAMSSFFMMTLLHAAHVVGGLIPMLIVTAGACRGRYSADRHGGVHYTTLYWHFLGGVWIGLFAVLKLWL